MRLRAVLDAAKQAEVAAFDVVKEVMDLLRVKHQQLSVTLEQVNGFTCRVGVGGASKSSTRSCR